MIRISSDIQTRRFTRAEYHRMAQAGILREDDRVELLDGVIASMSPIGPRHCSVVDRLTALLVPCLTGRAICRVQGAITLDEHSEPEPDIALLTPRDDFYSDSHPTAADVLLVIEVAETSIEQDRGEKLRLYAAAGIPEYWIVDLQRNVLIVHQRPIGTEYGSIQQLDRAATVAPAALPDLTLNLSELFVP